MDYDGRSRFSRENGVGRASEEVQDRFDLLSRYGRILLSELAWSHMLEVFENRGYGHSGSAKHPRTTDFSGNAFEHRAV
jgi:hypothetical protein